MFAYKSLERGRELSQKMRPRLPRKLQWQKQTWAMAFYPCFCCGVSVKYSALEIVHTGGIPVCDDQLRSLERLESCTIQPSLSSNLWHVLLEGKLPPTCRSALLYKWSEHRGVAAMFASRQSQMRPEAEAIPAKSDRRCSHTLWLRFNVGNARTRK